MDLTTTYMNLSLGSPLVPSASPLSDDLDTVRRLEDSGAGAIVLHSLFEEQIKHEARELNYYLEQGTESFAESLTYFPEPDNYVLGPEEYLGHIQAVREAVDIPVIASLNGISSSGWVDYAKQIEQAGAHGLELNVYFLPTDPTVSGNVIEDAHVAVLKAVAKQVSIPVAVKLSPFFSSTANMALRLSDAGASGLVLFNRFYQPDIDTETLSVRPRLYLSMEHESLLPLRWIAILHGRVMTSLAASTGVHTGTDAAKMILAGADAVMLCSALLRHGPEHLATITGQLREIMDRHGYGSIEEMKGVLSHRNCPEPAAFERANYMKILQSYQQTGTRE